ncbi:MAG: hypothetical protein ACK5LZ_06155 [Anaerorhabdus sp.]
MKKMDKIRVETKTLEGQQRALRIADKIVIDCIDGIEVLVADSDLVRYIEHIAINHYNVQLCIKRESVCTFTVSLK